MTLSWGSITFANRRYLSPFFLLTFVTYIPFITNFDSILIFDYTAISVTYMVAKNKSILLGSIVQEERLKLFLLEPSLLSVEVAGVVIVIWWCICWLNGWLVAPTVTKIGFSGVLDSTRWAAAFLTIHSEYTNDQTWQPSLVFLIKQKSICILSCMIIFGRLLFRYMMCVNILL